MSAPHFQTVRLSRGAHASPGDGACVMELASMLAGERFSDHPRSACPVIAMVLRAYNDGIDDERRQELYPYAAAVVGTRDRSARRARFVRCMRFFGQADAIPSFRAGSRLRSLGQAALGYATSADADAHAAFLRLLDDLVGGAPLTPPAAASSAGAPHPPARARR